MCNNLISSLQKARCVSIRSPKFDVVEGNSPGYSKNQTKPINPLAQ